jgi:hypothetical protein
VVNPENSVSQEGYQYFMAKDEEMRGTTQIYQARQSVRVSLGKALHLRTSAPAPTSYKKPDWGVPRCDDASENSSVARFRSLMEANRAMGTRSLEEDPVVVLFLMASRREIGAWEWCLWYQLSGC